MAGTIRASALVGNESATVETVFQFDKPSFVYIRQVSSSKDSRVCVVASDGKRFSYDVPAYLPSSKPGEDRLLEAVNQNGDILTCQEIYAASTASLKDRNMPLDLAFSRSTDLKFRRGQWATHLYLGEDKVRGIDAHVVGGDLREYATAAVGGGYKMWITDAGDLLRYEEDLTISLGKPRPGVPPQQVATIWDVDIKLNAETNKSLYVLP